MERFSIYGVGLAVAIVLTPADSRAETIDWTYIEAGYVSLNIDNIDLDNLDDDAGGWFGGFSLGLGKNFHLLGRYEERSTDRLSLDIDRWALGLGWHGLLGESADLVVDAAYVDAKLGPLEDHGYMGRGGIRWRPFKLFEIGAFARFEDLGDLDDDVVYQANVLVHLFRLGIGLQYETQKDIDSYNAFLRLNLGPK